MYSQRLKLWYIATGWSQYGEHMGTQNITEYVFGLIMPLIDWFILYIFFSQIQSVWICPAGNMGFFVLTWPGPTCWYCRGRRLTPQTDAYHYKSSFISMNHYIQYFIKMHHLYTIICIIIYIPLLHICIQYICIYVYHV